MKPILIIAILAFSAGLFAQGTRRIVNSSMDSAYTEKYYVLKNNKNIRQGDYRKYYMSVLGEQGQYDHNQKAGLWTYYDWDKKVYLTYDHTKNELVSFRPDTTRQIIIIGGDTLYDYVERPVLYLGSRLDLMYQALKYIKYPHVAADNMIDGRVCVGIVINEKGQAVDYYITESVEKSLDEEALEVVKKQKGQWIPAVYKNQTVKSVFVCPITFRIQWNLNTVN